MRYYWLKLKPDFFRDLRIIKLRRSPRGGELTLLYLELLVLALPTDGVLPLLGMEAPETELSLLLNAPESDCAALLAYLTAHGLLARAAENGLRLTMLEDYVGSETPSAADKRRQRDRQKPQADPGTETAGNGPAAAEGAFVFLPQPCPDNVRNCPAEKEKETDREKHSDTDPYTETQAEKKAVPADAPERESAAPLPDGAAAPPLPLLSGEDYYLTQKQVAEYAALYPEVDVPEQLRAMRGWLLSNPESRKPDEAVLRFVNGWLTKQQTMIRQGERRGRQPGGVPQAAGNCGDPYLNPDNARREERRPASYDIKKAMEEMRTTVPKLKKREKR